MGTKKISELPTSTDLYDGCCFPVVTNGETKKMTYALLKEKIKEDLPIADEDTLGVVKPIAKTSGMTQPVGVDESGRLYTLSSGASGALPPSSGMTDEERQQLNKNTENIEDHEERITDIENSTPSGGSSGISLGVRNALDNCFNHVAWIDENGQTYVDALISAIGNPSSGDNTDEPTTPDEPPTDEPITVNIADVADKTHTVPTNGNEIYVIYDVRAGDVIEMWASWNKSNANYPRYWEKAPVISATENPASYDYTDSQTAYGSTSIAVPEDECTHEVIQSYSYGKITFRPTRDYPTIVLNCSVNNSTYNNVGAKWTKVAR